MSDSEELLEVAKDAIRYKLLKVYESRGIQASLSLSDRFLQEAAKTGKEYGIQDFGKIIRGELSELYAEVCLREYVKSHKNSFYVKSLCFPRTDGKDGYTELDLTLFTDRFVMVMECKSYTGEKTLTNEGCMNVKGRLSYNVYNQNKMHLVNLNPYISKFRTRSVRSGAGKPYILVMFSYSRDDIVDLRDDIWKKKFRLLTEKNIDTYLSGLSKNEILWDVKSMYDYVQKMSRESADNKRRHIELSKKRSVDVSQG